jgi:hypothetical protein
MKKCTMPARPLALLAWSAGLALLTTSAHAAKQWDPYSAINFTVSGSDDEMAPSGEGDNGLQTRGFDVTQYDDTDHWIDPNESTPNNQGYPNESLPFGDINYRSDADAYFSNNDPLSSLGWADYRALQFNGSAYDTVGAKVSGNQGDDFTFCAPDEGGDFALYFTGTDADQVIGPGESGNRNDPDNTDNWWDLDPGQ